MNSLPSLPPTEPAPSILGLFHDSDFAGPLYFTVAFTALQLAIVESGRPWWPIAQKAFWIIGIIALLAGTWFNARALNTRWEQSVAEKKNKEVLQKSLIEQVTILHNISEGLGKSALALQSLQGQVASISASAGDLHVLVEGLQGEVAEVDEGIHQHIKNSNYRTGRSTRGVEKKLDEVAITLQVVLQELAQKRSEAQGTMLLNSSSPDPRVQALHKAFLRLKQTIGDEKPIYPARLFNALASIDGAMGWSLFGPTAWEPTSKRSSGPKYWLNDPKFSDLSDWFVGTIGEDGRITAIEKWKDNVQVPEEVESSELSEAIDQCSNRTDFRRNGRTVEEFWGEIEHRRVSRIAAGDVFTPGLSIRSVESLDSQV